MKNNRGLFVTFEGPEASGKSSQIILLKKFLKLNKTPFLITREPGGTFFSEKLRKLILNKSSRIDVSEEILLLMAARLNHIKNVIKPALKKNMIVLCDRYADSTFVYQGYVNGYGIKKTMNLHKKILDNFLPDKTFLFLIPPKEIILRLKKRRHKNKYDIKKIKFHNKVCEGYKNISKNNSRFININADQDKNSIHLEIISNLGFK